MSKNFTLDRLERHDNSHEASFNKLGQDRNPEYKFAKAFFFLIGNINLQKHCSSKVILQHKINVAVITQNHIY